MQLPDTERLPSEPDRVFATLLRSWRRRRGLSQFELGLRADVSARHVSFLETGKSRPSREMVHRLAAELDVPDAELDVLLREAGFAPPPAGEVILDPAIESAIDAMLRYHEPFPMLVLDRAYNVLRQNAAARRIIERTAGPVHGPWNAMLALFDPEGMRPYVVGWEATAQTVVGQIHREALRDSRARELLDQLLGVPGVPPAWREPDLTRGTEVSLPLGLRVGGEVLSFTGTLSAFRAPQRAMLNELLIGSYLPADPATERACIALAG